MTTSSLNHNFLSARAGTNPGSWCNEAAVAVNLQDLRLILRLVAGLLFGDPLLAQALLNVTIVYTSSQQMDWLDILAASLNVLPALAAASSAPGT
jgi:hypothetical protein